MNNKIAILVLTSIIVAILGTAAVLYQTTCDENYIIIEQSDNNGEYDRTYQNLSEDQKDSFKKGLNDSRVSVEMKEWRSVRSVRYKNNTYTIDKIVNECGETSFLADIGLVMVLFGLLGVLIGYRRMS